MKAGPVAQLSPTASGSACSMEARKASAACPPSMVPEVSMVPDTTSGRRVPASSNTLSAAIRAALVLRVSWQVSMNSRSTPPSSRPRICSAKVATSSEKVMPPVTEIARVVGPTEPATKRGLSGVESSRAASTASSAARRLSARASASRPYSASTSGVPPKVSVSMMSAPASR